MRTNKLAETPLVADPHAEVEQMYIAEYLKGKGYTLEDLARLPKAVAKALMEAASLHASLRLAEFETGAALVDSLHLDEALTMPPVVDTTIQPA